MLIIQLRSRHSKLQAVLDNIMLTPDCLYAEQICKLSHGAPVLPAGGENP